MHYFYLKLKSYFLFYFVKKEIILFDKSSHFFILKFKLFLILVYDELNLKRFKQNGYRNLLFSQNLSLTFF